MARNEEKHLGNMVHVRVSKEFEELLERRALAWDTSASEYIRDAVLFEALSACDSGALKMMSKGLTEKLKEIFKGVFSENSQRSMM
jgi:hypothetical protein